MDCLVAWVVLQNKFNFHTEIDLDVWLVGGIVHNIVINKYNNREFPPHLNVRIFFWMNYSCTDRAPSISKLIDDKIS